MKEFVIALVFVGIISLVTPDIVRNTRAGTNDPPATPVRPTQGDPGGGVRMDFVRVPPETEVKRSLTIFGKAPRPGSIVRIVSAISCEATHQQIVVWRFVRNDEAKTVNIVVFNNGHFATKFEQNAVYEVQADEETVIQFKKIQYD